MWGAGQSAPFAGFRNVVLILGVLASLNSTGSKTIICFNLNFFASASLDWESGFVAGAPACQALPMQTLVQTADH